MSRTSPLKATIFPKPVFVSYHRTFGEIQSPTPSSMSSLRSFHPAFKATYKVNTQSPFRYPAIASTFPQNACPLHPSPRYSLQIALPLHPHPLHRSRLRHPSSRRSPLSNRSKRTLLRPLRLAYISLLHSVESLFA